ncbi:chemotaxis protein CheYIV [Erythrobacter litoralis HTCC2594]|uniref:Chemotaxis protein CheYIV n=2 Tax=Erythrobacter litoralis TaxID=39960 RepID=Q2NB84_ERYLH|nr:chemotaxis protein CheYIV [Erythrobacter litoralis HTCC2594]
MDGVPEVPVPAPEALTSQETEAVAEELELDPVEAAVAAALADRDGEYTAGGKRCLIVDDSRVVRKLSRMIAEDMGYRVAEAENGEEALARCAKAMPDLVITDWQMPVMSGVDFVAKLRAIPGADRTKVMFCTSKGETTDIHAGISAGADDYIVKPFDEAKLKAKLERLVT